MLEAMQQPPTVLYTNEFFTLELALMTALRGSGKHTVNSLYTDVSRFPGVDKYALSHFETILSNYLARKYVREVNGGYERTDAHVPFPEETNLV